MVENLYAEMLGVLGAAVATASMSGVRPGVAPSRLLLRPDAAAAAASDRRGRTVRGWGERQAGERERPRDIGERERARGERERDGPDRTFIRRDGV